MRVGKHHYPLIGFGGYFCGSFVRFAQKFIALLCMKIKILGMSDYNPTIERGLPCKCPQGRGPGRGHSHFHHFIFKTLTEIKILHQN